MKRNFFTYLAGFILIIVWMSAASLILGFPLMWLWNWIMPTLFGLIKIGYWQSVGLILICNILFKGTIRLSNNG